MTPIRPIAGSNSPAHIVAAPERYAGWLHGAPDTLLPLDRLTENVVTFRHGWTEIWRFTFSHQLESTWHTDERCYFLSLMLDGPPETERRNVALAQPAPYGGKRVRLVPPGQTIHSVSAAGGQVRVMRCFLDAAYLESLCPGKPTDVERAQLGAVDLSGSMIEWLLLRMYREIGNADVGMATAVDGIARAIAIEIARVIEQRRPAAHGHGTSLPSWRMRLIVDRIYADGPLPKIAELAELCGMTVRQLGRAFRTETGGTLGRFIAAAMAERAATMLEEGMPVAAIAATFGYASSSSFAHAFERETGRLPSSMRAAR